MPGDLGEEAALAGRSEISPFPYSREWPVERAVPRKGKLYDLGELTHLPVPQFSQSKNKCDNSSYFVGSL